MFMPLSIPVVMSTSTSVIFMIFIFIIDTGPRLSLTGLKLFYDDVKTSQITSIYDVFVKSLQELIYDI
jgi:hypothetical protein